MIGRCSGMIVGELEIGTPVPSISGICDGAGGETGRDIKNEG